MIQSMSASYHIAISNQQHSIPKYDFMKPGYTNTQGLRIDFKNEGAKTVLHLSSPEGASMLGTGGEIFLFCFSRAQENAFPGAFFKIFYGVP